ncbi:hypothetical protein ACG9X6_21990 [Acinetobacter guillouiae]|uniref:hypothetical protein n=1 Tax=Acinetobacter TaxID=469 RepID=UPI001FB91E8D|nr:hypothetical protein [Acinetobacter sp. NyZ410]UOH19739.1 hypothetical protein MTO68_06200 [Acinetobacter sp. NyZ410]
MPKVLRSLPSRQLRNVFIRGGDDEYGLLPPRQLRKIENNSATPDESSLPSRQLRKT